MQEISFPLILLLLNFQLVYCTCLFFHHSSFCFDDIGVWYFHMDDFNILILLHQSLGFQNNFGHGYSDFFYFFPEDIYNQIH